MSETILSSKFTLWIFDDNKQSNETFEQKLKPVLTFGTMQQFWQFFAYLIKPSRISECMGYVQFLAQSDIYIFKEGIRPLWEDVNNAKGGYYAFKIQKNKADKIWENAVFALISPLKQIASCINGVRVKIKENFCNLQIWMNSKVHDSPLELKMYLKDSLQIYDDRSFFFANFQHLIKGLKIKQKEPGTSKQQAPREQKQKQRQRQLPSRNTQNTSNSYKNINYNKQGRKNGSKDAYQKTRAPNVPK